MNTNNTRFSTAMMPWLVWGLAASYFFCEYFARVAPTVMVEDLMRSFEVTAAGLGGIHSFFYIPYLAMQVPVGLLVDRFGVARLLTIMCVTSAISCAVFGSATTIYGAELGQFLLGLGASFAFVSALKLASEWFPASRWGLLASLTQALGMLGGFVGQYPVSMLAEAIGWRGAMYCMVVIFLCLSVLIGLFVRDAPVNNRVDMDTVTEPERTSNREMLKSLKCVLSHRFTWLNATYAGLIYAPTAVFAEMWGVAYLEHVQGLSHASAAFANGLIFIGWGFGGPFMGWLSDKLEKRKMLMGVSAIAGILTMGTVLYVPHLSTLSVYVLLFLFGATNTGVALAYAVAAEVNPIRYSGAAMAFTNMASVIIGAILQPIVGALLDLNASGEIVNNVPVYSASDFHSSMVLIPLCSIAALFLIGFLRETHCKNISDKILN